MSPEGELTLPQQRMAIKILRYLVKTGHLPEEVHEYLPEGPEGEDLSHQGDLALHIIVDFYLSRPGGIHNIYALVQKFCAEERVSMAELATFGEQCVPTYKDLKVMYDIDPERIAADQYDRKIAPARKDAGRELP